MPNKRASHSNAQGFSGRRGNDSSAGMSRDLANLRPFLEHFTVGLPRVASTAQQGSGLFIPSNMVIIAATIDIEVPEATSVTKTINVGFAANILIIANAIGVGPARASRTGQQVWASAQSFEAAGADGFTEIMYAFPTTTFAEFVGNLILLCMDTEISPTV